MPIILAPNSVISGGLSNVFTTNERKKGCWKILVLELPLGKKGKYDGYYTPPPPQSYHVPWKGSHFTRSQDRGSLPVRHLLVIGGKRHVFSGMRIQFLNQQKKGMECSFSTCSTHFGSGEGFYRHQLAVRYKKWWLFIHTAGGEFFPAECFFVWRFVRCTFWGKPVEQTSFYGACATQIIVKTDAVGQLCLSDQPWRKHGWLVKSWI